MSADFSFIFRSGMEVDEDLGQGDIIRRSDAVISMLSQPHGYYASADDYSHFMVLTQSCDLVRYRGEIKSSYITIASLRPFSKFVEKIIRRSDCSREGAPVQILRSESKLLLKQKIEQLLHYDLPGYFFIPAGVVPSIDVPLVSFLQLAVSIKSEHYQICQNARVGALENVFAAKLGWLTGNQYSRVATPDLDGENEHGVTSALVGQLFDEYIDNEVFWFSQKRLAAFDRELERKIAVSGEALSREDALSLASSIPPEIDEVAQIVGKLASNYLPEDRTEALCNQVRNNRRLQKLVSSSS